MEQTQRVLRTIFDHIHTDTVQSAFTFPVDEIERANVNWIISTFDIVIFYEISDCQTHYNAQRNSGASLCIDRRR